MRISCVCFVLILRWPVDILIQFSSTAGDTAWVSFAIRLKLLPSGLLKMLLNTLVFCSLPRRQELKGLLLMRVQATGIF